MKSEHQIVRRRRKLPELTQDQERRAEEDASKRERQHAASVFHVNAGGIGGIAADAEADVSIVTLTARNGSSIRISWDAFSGGFRINGESSPEHRNCASCLEVLPMSGNVVVVRCKTDQRPSKKIALTTGIRHRTKGSWETWEVWHVGGLARTVFGDEDGARQFLIDHGVDEHEIVVLEAEPLP